MAAVLTCGDGAALSHPDAVALWDMGRPPAGAIHVIVPRPGGQRHAFLELCGAPRDAPLAAAGYRTLRFTDRQIARDARSVVAAIRAATARPGGGP